MVGTKVQDLLPLPTPVNPTLLTMHVKNTPTGKPKRKEPKANPEWVVSWLEPVPNLLRGVELPLRRRPRRRPTVWVDVPWDSFPDLDNTSVDPTPWGFRPVTQVPTTTTRPATAATI